MRSLLVSYQTSDKVKNAEKAFQLNVSPKQAGVVTFCELGRNLQLVLENISTDTFHEYDFAVPKQVIKFELIKVAILESLFLDFLH